MSTEEYQIQTKMRIFSPLNTIFFSPNDYKSLELFAKNSWSIGQDPLSHYDTNLRTFFFLLFQDSEFNCAQAKTM